MGITRIQAREATGYFAVWTLSNAGGTPIGDITGWTFEAAFERQAGATDFSMGMVADPLASTGFKVHDGLASQIMIGIRPATLQAIADTTGRFEIRADLLATPPGQPRMLLKPLILTVSRGPTA